jgi:hypothetical protein
MIKWFEKNKVHFSIDTLSLAKLIYPILHEHCYGLENGKNWKDLIPLIKHTLRDITIDDDREIRKAKEALLNGLAKPVISYGNNGIFVAKNQEEIDLFMKNQKKYAMSALRNMRSCKFIKPELAPFPKEDDGFFGFMTKDKND